MKLNWKTCIVVCASLFLLFLATQYWSGIAGTIGILWASARTLLLGAAIAYGVNILMRLYEKKIAPQCSKPLWVKLRRPVCMLLAFLTLLAAIVLLVRIIFPQLVSCFDNLVNALTNAVPQLYTWLDTNFALGEYLQENNIPTDMASINWRALLEEYAHILLSGFGGVMNVAVSFTTSLLSVLVTLFLGVIFACNILSGKERIGSQFYRLCGRVLGRDMTARVRHVLQVLDDCFHSYIVGQLTEALILGILCTLGMLLFRMPYAPMIGTLIGVTALIPIAGAYIGAGVGAIMLFSVSPYQALGFIVFIVVLQQIEGNLIYPHIVGNSLHLPGIWVLAAVSIGGGMMGIPGMLLFVPLTAAVYRLLGEWASNDSQPSLAERISSLGRDTLQAEEGAADPAPVPPPAPRPDDRSKGRRSR